MEQPAAVKQPLDNIDTRELRLREMSLEDLSKLGEAFLIERLKAEAKETDWSEKEKAKLPRAIEVAVYAHDLQERGPGRRFVPHPLRNALRILSRDELGMRDNPTMIVSTILHDTVEDSAERTVIALSGRLPVTNDARSEALRQIEIEFGDEDSRIVGSVSRSPYPDNMIEQSERDEHNIVFIEDNLLAEGPESIVKFVDFVDNCGRLLEHEAFIITDASITDRSKWYRSADKMARKYALQFPIYQSFVVSTTLFNNHQRVWATRMLADCEAALMESNKLIDVFRAQELGRVSTAYDTETNLAA